jgi:hypothetical protein
MVLRREIHTAGKIEYSAWALKLENKAPAVYSIGAQVVDLAAAFAKGETVPDEVIETNVPRPMLRLLANCVEDGNPMGSSDFDQASIQLQRSLMAALNDLTKNVREKQMGGILVMDESQKNTTGRGLMVVEGGVANLWGAVHQDRSGRPTIDRDKLKLVFENDRTRQSTRYVSIEDSHAASVKLIEMQARMLAFMQDVSIGQLFQESGGGQVSGVVLKMKMLPTTTAVEAGNVWLVPQLQELLYDAQVYEMHHRESNAVPAKSVPGWPDVYEPQLPSVVLNSGLFEPESDKVDAVAKRTQGEAATMSITEGIQLLNHCTKEEAEGTFDRILKEQLRVMLLRAEVDSRGMGALLPAAAKPAEGDARHDSPEAPVTQDETRDGAYEAGDGGGQPEPPEDFSTGSTSA